MPGHPAGMLPSPKGTIPGWTNCKMYFCAPINTSTQTLSNCRNKAVSHEITANSPWLSDQATLLPLRGDPQISFSSKCNQTSFCVWLLNNVF